VAETRAQWGCGILGPETCGRARTGGIAPLAPAAGRTTAMRGLSMSGRGITVEDVLKNPKFPQEWPFKAVDFARQDESDDVIFYEQVFP